MGKNFEIYFNKVNAIFPSKQFREISLRKNFTRFPQCEFDIKVVKILEVHIFLEAKVNKMTSTYIVNFFVKKFSMIIIMVVFGLSLALQGEITARNGRIVERNFHEYPVQRINDTPRELNVEIVDSTAPPGGAGEPGVPPIAPALANAVFAATGKRLRDLPLRL